MRTMSIVLLGALASPVAGAVVVYIHHFACAPASLTVPAGETVRWENRDSIEHTATGQTGPGTLIPSGVFDSGLLGEGGAFEFTFTTPGTYHYFCIPHGSSMQGVVTVLPGCDSVDFNGDGLFPDTADIDDFLGVFSGGQCSTGACGDLDFNNDGLFPDTADIDALLSVFSGGPCH